MRNVVRTSLGAGATLLLVATSSRADTPIFDDDFAKGVTFQAFLGSELDVLSVDEGVAYSGTASLRIEVPGGPAWAGGTFTASAPEDLSGDNALSFWARASEPTTLDVAGFGNSNDGFDLFPAWREFIPIATEWTKVVVPVPRPDRLTEETGLFFFAASSQKAVDVWIDQLAFETLGTISNPRPSIVPESFDAFVGQARAASETRAVFDVNGADVDVEHAPAYFTFFSSEPSVVEVDEELLLAVAPGQAVVTARLDDVDATGQIDVNVIASPDVATSAIGLPASDVISLFSDHYVDVLIDTWSADWDQAQVTDLEVDGDAIKAYTDLVFAGIEFATDPIDAGEMTHFIMDVWLATGTHLRVKLVDFGPDGMFGGGDDSDHELSFTGGSDPPLGIGDWQRLEIPLDDFKGLAGRSHLTQLILSGDPGTLFIDNVMFTRGVTVAIVETSWGDVKARHRPTKSKRRH